MGICCWGRRALSKAFSVNRLTVSTDATEDEVKQLALADEKVQAAIEGRQIVKVVVVPRKLVNIVVK